MLVVSKVCEEGRSSQSCLIVCVVGDEVDEVHANHTASTLHCTLQSRLWEERTSKKTSRNATFPNPHPQCRDGRG
eukprot:scaffold2621_cov164-Ochromonas_danica.AAC.9